MAVYAKGHNGQVTVDPDSGWVTIARKGLGRLGHSKGDQRIPIRSITAVQMRPAGPIANGFIRFTVPGAPGHRGGLSNAGSDEYAVIFTRKHQAEFDEVRATVERVIGGVNATAPQPPAAPPSIAEQLAHLGRLHAQGVLDDAEFATAKAQLLGG